MKALLLCGALWLLAFSVRAVYLLEIQESPLFHALMGDAWKHDAWAQEIAGGDWLGKKTFFISPTYAYFLGGIYALFGHSTALARWVQAGLGATSCVLLAGAGRHLLGSGAGMLAGLLLAVTPSALFFDGLIQKSALDLFFLCLLLFLVGRALRRPGPGRWLAAGAALGLFSLTRENGLLLLPVVSAWLWLRFRPLPAARRLRWLALLGVGTALALAPVTLRNLWVGGEFHPTSSQFGVAFYMGNNREATGTYAPLRWGRGNIEFEEEDSIRLAEKELGRSLSPREVSQYWLGKALAEIRSDPARWLWLLARKWLLVWNSTEIGDAEDLYTYADSSLLLRGLQALFHFGVLCPLAVFGAVVTWRKWRDLSLLYLVLLGYSASVALFMVFARYRFPLVPVLLILAAGGLAEGWARARAWRWALPGWAALAGLAAAIPVNTAMLSQDFIRSNTHYNLGTLLMKQGRHGEAIQELQTSLRYEPNAPSAHTNLGYALAAQGRRKEAIASFKEALRLRPDYPVGHYNLGVAYSEEGDAAAAVRHFQESLRLEPEQPAAHYNLGTLSYRQGRLEEALAEYAEALRLNPSMVEAHQAMALAFAKQGRIGEAVSQLLEVVRLRPDDRETHYKIGLLLQALGRSDEAAPHFAAAGRAPPRPPAGPAAAPEPQAAEPAPSPGP